MIKYLKEGKQTEITPEILEISSQIRGSGIEFIKNTFNWIPQHIKHTKDKEIKSKVFRKRTAKQIIDDGFTTGCTDIALVFVVLCRAKGIPTKYIEAIRKTSDGLSGHVFAECYINNNWICVDPTNMKVGDNSLYKGCDIIGEGLDFSDIKTETIKDLKKKTKLFRKIDKNY